MPSPMCRHCVVKVASRPRGLCWPCYYTPGVKDRFPSTSIHGRRSPITDTHSVRPLPEPTDTRPGSAERLVVLESRAVARLAIFHPLDRRVEGKVAMPGLIFGARVMDFRGVRLD